MNAERIYSHLPISLQNLALTAYGWRVNRKRYNAHFHELLNEGEERASWSVERTCEFRDLRLTAFVQHAARTVPYYRALFARLRLDPAAIRRLDDLKLLPILTKAEVRQDLSQFISENAAPPHFTAHTSGTTGAGLRFPVAWDAHREQFAVWWRYWRSHGIKFAQSCAYFGGRSVVPVSQRRPPYWRHNRASRQVLFSSYHLSETTAPFYLDEIERRGIAWLHGYPSMLALLASLALKSGRRLAGVRWVTCGAENLLPHQAKVMQAAFSVAPLHHYGMTEGVANISMCPQRNLHVDEDFAAVEFAPLGDGQCTILGTNLANPVFPLLRYQVGDMASMAERSCSCGRPGRIVASLDGRQEDYVITRNGSRVGRLDHLFKDQVHIREAQIQQQEAGKVVVAIVKDQQFTAGDEAALRAEIEERLGSDLICEFKYVTSLSRTANGKLRLVISTAEGAGILGSGAGHATGTPEHP